MFSRGALHLPVLIAKCDSEESRFRKLAAASGPSCSKSKMFEEAAMPRQPFTRSRTLPISPGDSPSRIAGCHRRYRNRHSASLRVSHVCAELTVEQNAATRNRKTFRPCEEAVDDETLLWRAEENGKEIAPGADSRAHHSSSLISSDESPWRSLECRRCDPSQSPTRAAINPTRPCTLPISTGGIW